MNGLQGMIAGEMFGKKKKIAKKPVLTTPPTAPVTGIAPSIPAGIAVGKKLKI